MESRNTNDEMMACAAPPPLTDDVLWAALDGDAPAPIQAHLERCRYCSARLEGMRMFEDTLLTAIYRADCPTTQELTDYVMGTASEQVVLAIDDHLLGCSLCSEEVRMLRAFFVTDGVAAVDEAPAEPEPLWQPFKDLFQSMGDQLVRILSPELIPVHEHKKGAAPTPMLIYRTETLSVMLKLEAKADRLSVHGTIENEDSKTQGVWRNGTVELISQDANHERYLALIDDYETFTFKSVAAGRFNMNIYDVGGSVLRLKDVDIAV